MTPDAPVTAREFDLLRRSIDDLAATVAQQGRQSSREHAEVRSDLRELRRQIDTGVPSKTEYAAFKQHVYTRLDQHDEDLASRKGVDRTLTRVAAVIVGAATVGGVLFAVAARFVG